MTQNDIIAEYVKKNHPEIIASPQFAVFVIKKGIENFVNDLTKAIKRSVKELEQESEDEKI